MKKMVRFCNAKEIYDSYLLNNGNPIYDALYSMLLTVKNTVSKTTDDENLLWYAINEGFISSFDMVDKNVLDAYITVKDDCIDA